MLENCNKEYVFAQRGQDSEPWVGKTSQMVYTDVRTKDGVHKGDFTGVYFVEDTRGYSLPCHASQLQPATKEDWEKALKEKEPKQEKGFSGLEVFWNTGGGTNACSDRRK